MTVIVGMEEPGVFARQMGRGACYGCSNRNTLALPSWGGICEAADWRFLLGFLKLGKLAVRAAACRPSLKNVRRPSVELGRQMRKRVVRSKDGDMNSISFSLISLRLLEQPFRFRNGSKLGGPAAD